MGDPVKIIDIINSIVNERNSQFNIADQNIQIKVIGIRPGEKLHEKLYDEENIEETENKFILNEKKLIQGKIQIKNFLEDLNTLHHDREIFKDKLLKFINF